MKDLDPELFLARFESTYLDIKSSPLTASPTDVTDSVVKVVARHYPEFDEMGVLVMSVSPTLDWVGVCADSIVYGQAGKFGRVELSQIRGHRIRDFDRLLAGWIQFELVGGEALELYGEPNGGALRLAYMFPQL